MPVAVQRRLHRARREGAAGAGPREPRRRRRLAVRQGPLCLPGDPCRRAHHPAAGPRRRQPPSGLVGARARGRRRPRRHKGHVGALVGGQATNEEGFLLGAADARGPRLAPHRLAHRRADRARPRPRARRPRRCRPPSPTSSSPTPCWWSAASRSTTPRSSTCGSARACAAAPSTWRSPPHGPARSTSTPSWCCATRPAARPRSCASWRPRWRAARPPTRSAAWPSCSADGGEDIVILWGERTRRRRRRTARDRRAARAGRPRRRRVCWRSPPAQTAAGFAKPAHSPTPAPAMPTRPRSDTAPRRSEPLPPTAS